MIRSVEQSIIDNSSINDRVISLGPNLPKMPERLLLAHARGEVLFVVGAGVSKSAGLPDFRGIVLKVYEQLDLNVHAVISRIPQNANNQWDFDSSGLTDQQSAEIRRFIKGDYDVVLGLLERRMDRLPHNRSRVRQTVSSELRRENIRPAPIHRALMRLSDRGGAVVIVTTNFELLLENAHRVSGSNIQTYALGGIPRPGRGEGFTGVLHLHGVLDRNPARISDLVLTEQDFGEYYLRRRIVPDFIYDAARLYNLVLVGYSGNDPPMRYLLNAVAADGSRFGDLKERFAFIGQNNPDPISIEDWKGRGITPISYESNNNHEILFYSLKRWADLSAITGRKILINSEIKRIVKKSRASANDYDRDLFDHLIRRSDSNERIRLSSLAAQHKADFGWLDAIAAIENENEKEIR